MTDIDDFAIFCREDNGRSSADWSDVANRFTDLLQRLIGDLRAAERRAYETAGRADRLSLEVEELKADNAQLRDVVQSLYDTLEGKWEHGARVGHDDLRIAGAMVEEVGCG